MESSGSKRAMSSEGSRKSRRLEGVVDHTSRVLDPFPCLTSANVGQPSTASSFSAAPVARTGNAASSSTSDNIADEISRVIASMETRISDRVPQWKDLVDDSGTKDLLEEMVLLPFQYPQIFARVRGNGLLLYGPSGCGKTILVQSIVRECGCSFLDVSPSVLYSKWQGNTEIAIKALIVRAMAIAPCIVFIDEIDTMLQDRGGLSDSGSANLAKSEFLKHWTSLKGTGVMIVGATNRPWVIDSAFIRRLSSLVYIGPPGTKARFELLRSTIAEYLPDSQVPSQNTGAGSGTVQMYEPCTKETPNAFYSVRGKLDPSRIKHRSLTYRMLDGRFALMRPRCTKEEVRRFEEYDREMSGTIPTTSDRPFAG
ncbi:MAG: hypothetical protein Q9208_002400 [Pyrenodesmia sp. 3 TL-2023]